MNKLWSMGIYVDNDGEGWMVSAKWQSGEMKTSDDVNIGKMGGDIFVWYREADLSAAIDRVLQCLQLMNVKRCDEMDICDFAIYFVNKHKMREKDKMAYAAVASTEAAKRGWEFYVEKES